MRTQVGIIGAGPAGLMLARLLHLAGIDSVIIENRDRAYIENRIRAGLIEHWAADLLTELGVGERMNRESMVHWGNNIGINGASIIWISKRLCGKRVTIYGQQEIVKDMVAQRLADGCRCCSKLMFSVHGSDDGAAENKVYACWPRAGDRMRFHRRLRRISRHLPAEHSGQRAQCFRARLSFRLARHPRGSPPPDHELIYSYTDRGFALYTMRSPTVSRLYLQCGHDEAIESWPDARIWDELHKRLGGARTLAEGEILQKGVTPMRSFVAEPMQHGRFFSPATAAHIVPPTGAKGINLAFADVVYLSRAIDAHLQKASAPIFWRAIRRNACGGYGRRNGFPGG